MADRQIFQLTTKAPLLTDVIGLQDAAGGAEQGKATLQTVKDLLLTGVAAPVGKRVVIKINSGGSITGVIMETEIPGLSVMSVTSTTNLYVVRVSANVFSSAKTAPSVNNIVTNFQSYYLAQPFVAASDQIAIRFIRYNGGTYTDAIPPLTDYFLTLLIYP